MYTFWLVYQYIMYHCFNPHPLTNATPYLSTVICDKNHTPKGMTRRDGSVCARLRIGHTYLTHCYLKGEPQPFCVSCNEALTINHLLTNCAEFADIKLKHYSANTLEEVLTSGNYTHVLSFLKEVNLYKKV